MKNELPSPKGINRLSNAEILTGNIIAPLDRLSIIDEDTYEDMVLEWLTSFGNKYEKLMSFAGSGDKGRDVIAYTDYANGKCEFYQCKHYKSALTPSDVYLEFGKLIYYTFNKDYECPLKFYFVAPHGIGAKLHELIGDINLLRKSLLENWDEKCKNKITKTKQVELDQTLVDYINNFDFTIISSVEPIEFIEGYKKTTYYSYRFGGGLQKSRKEIAVSPVSISSNEIPYVRNIYDAYSSRLNKVINSQNDFKEEEALVKHFLRQRNNFYHADSLEQFSRDALPLGNDAFSALKNEVCEQIIEVYESDDYKDGVAKMDEIIKMAKTGNYNSNPLAGELKSNDKAGICHHLSNENRIKWI
ncbi:ABC-three component system protein [Flavobacterium johnsoniae]|uniref:ABC-three component system protein n=1 Tax=Flavobacterium johnsoniae TaxID=986 RepID=UPI0011ED70D9|nr:ABC-three component system protein [Flavobacterium johnsoniae]